MSCMGRMSCMSRMSAVWAAAPMCQCAVCTVYAIYVLYMCSSMCVRAFAVYVLIKVLAAERCDV